MRQIKCDSEIRKRTVTWIDEIILKPGSILKVVYFSMKKEILPTVYLGCDSFDRLWEKKRKYARLPKNKNKRISHSRTNQDGNSRELTYIVYKHFLLNSFA